MKQSEQGTTKDQVSLDALKRSLDAVNHDHPYLDYSRLEGLAWQMAFEWRNKFEMVTELQTPSMVEYREGMALIREKLA